ncbi:hypothetical protein CLS_15210 [[Clostridium] cf. saccharolyticum K10]|nr:hypothetical protein CLS_15210 [[Clostridium] cf. saccharolyticum K10]
MIQEYKVSGYIKAGGVVLPVLDIPQMSDEEWNRRAREQAVRQYQEETRQEPENIGQAVSWLRDKIAGMTEIGG